MYKLIGKNGVVGTFETIQFIKKSEANANIGCSRQEADAIFAGNKIYSISGSPDYADYEEVSVSEVDSALETAGKLAYIEALANIG